MRRLLPASLMAQMALLIGAALLVAQLVNFAFILNEREKLSLAQNQQPAIARFAAVTADFVRAPAEFRFAVLEDGSRRGAEFRTASGNGLPPEVERDDRLERRLAEELREAGVAFAEVRAGVILERRPPRQGARAGATAGREVNRLLLSARLGASLWLNGRIAAPRPDPWLQARLAAATLALYVIVLGATLLAVARLVRPLRDLAAAADRFGGRDSPPSVDPSGPSDLRRAIHAFNAMNRRVAALLDEKDRMLGAIGHDLRTPLASFRIRAESIEPEEERRRAIATIDQMAAMLEDILVLARSGRAREEARPMDVRALVDALVEEMREIGLDARIEPGERVVARVQPLLLRRAVGNLLENAVKYGSVAQVRVEERDGGVAIEVKDEGAGLPQEELERVLEPFYRGEGSRNRGTGGAGLGLAIARAVAESHGGGLNVRNGERGLVATLTLPAG
jgi:signal transduction histidine kinase